MSKHHHDDCCYPSMLPMGGYGAVGGSGGYGAGMGIRWIYALLILIVIVLQFGRNNKPCENVAVNTCCDDGAVAGTGVLGSCNNQLIDNSVLFIIVVFLLILCAGCFWGGNSSGGTGYGAGFGGYGY